MGTNNETIEVQSQIKSLVAELGWSQNRLARILYTEMNEWDDEEEILKYQQRLKKELQRSTTKVKRLKEYLNIIVNHPDAKKLDVVLNRYIPQGSVSDSLSRGLREVSQEIDGAYNKKGRGQSK